MSERLVKVEERAKGEGVLFEETWERRGTTVDTAYTGGGESIQVPAMNYMEQYVKTYQEYTRGGVERRKAYYEKLFGTGE